MRADTTTTPQAVHSLVGQVLDDMAITDIVYHEFEHTRPVVEDMLFALLNQVDAGSRVLAIGPNSLLAQGVLSAGYQLDLWRLGQNLLADELDAYVRGALSPEALAGPCLPFGETSWDAMLLPFVFEHVPTGPGAVLAALLPHLRRGGVVIAATRNLGGLGPRFRILLGKRYLPDVHPQEIAFSMNWPDLKPYRYYLPSELLAYGQQVGLRLVESSYSVGHHAFNGADVFDARTYAALKIKHWIKGAVPPLRDCVVLSWERARAEDQRRGLVPAPVGGVETGDGPGETAPTPLPLVSVVVPTRNRSAMLRDCFSGLSGQTYPPQRFEVLVVDDGSTDDTAQMAAELKAAAPFEVRYFKTSGVGAIAARNLGMREARGEIVAHLDDDNRPCPGWLEEGVSGFGPGVAIVGGPVLPKPEQPIPFFHFTANYDREQGIYPSSNIFFRREVALAAGGFDESFGGNVMGRPVFGWDADLGWRLRRAGHRSRFRPGAVAYQEVLSLAPHRWVLDAWRWVSLPVAVRRVPELGRYALFQGYFAHPLSFRFDLALLGVGLAVLRRRWEPLALVVPWVFWLAGTAPHDRWPPWRWPRILVKILFLHLRQAFLLAALLAGSLKARRLVL